MASPIQPTTAGITSDIAFGLGVLASFGAKVDIVGIYAMPGSSSGSGSSKGSGTSTSSGSGSSGQSILATLSNNTLVNSLLGKNSSTAAFGQLFAGARPLKATVRETSKVMEHPVEVGSSQSPSMASLADFHIINPIEIDLPLLIVNKTTGGISSLFGGAPASNYATIYAQIRQYYVNATPLCVKTRTGSYQNMIIADMPHEEDAEIYNGIILNLHLKQVQLFKAGTTTLQTSYQPLAAANSNTLASGLQQVASIGTKLLTTGLSVMSYASLAKRL